MVDHSRKPLDRVFHALSDPTRRAILGRLVRGPALVTELARPFPTSLAAVSKHLRVLEAAGLLTRRIEGREHHCALRPAPLRGAAEWILFYQKFWDSKLDALEAFLVNASPKPESTHGRPRRKR
ncbi:MAG TPA: metalloregulator ArsR/SmtB family transcription factor [Gemmatimonadales bacterium]|jgi:DNA-binding transcriptional ArsR family regulator